MMKLETIRAARADSRKRGADMTNALLWAAFAIVVLISILGMYQVVQLNSNKTNATRTMSTVSNEARTLYRNATDFGTTNLNNTLVQAGAVTNDAIGGTDAARLITLPYGTSVVFTGAGQNFTATMTFPENSRGARALCTFLTSGDKDALINGPLGSDYSLPEATTCATAGGDVVATYSR